MTRVQCLDIARIGSFVYSKELWWDSILDDVVANGREMHNVMLEVG